MRNTKAISRLIAIMIFAVALVGGSSIVNLLRESGLVVNNAKLTDSNSEQVNVLEIKANVLVSNTKLDVTKKAEVQVSEAKEEEEVEPVVYDGLTKTELVRKLNKVLKSTLKGTGESFATYSLKKGVDPYLAVAIVLQETGCYYGSCSALVKKCYNVGGLKNGKGYACYSSKDQGIKSYINILYKNYASKGLKTAKQMNPYYAEDKGWASKVNNYIKIIKNS